MGVCFETFATQGVSRVDGMKYVIGQRSTSRRYCLVVTILILHFSGVFKADIAHENMH